MVWVAGGRGKNRTDRQAAVESFVLDVSFFPSLSLPPGNLKGYSRDEVRLWGTLGEETLYTASKVVLVDDVQWEWSVVKPVKLGR